MLLLLIGMCSTHEETYRWEDNINVDLKYNGYEGMD
jgi:hypothetical protein